MTTLRQLIIPGLDHSLFEVDGLLRWKQTGDIPPLRKSNAFKRRKTEAGTGGGDGQETAQGILWEDMA